MTYPGDLEFVPMHRRRPAWLEGAIDKDYADARRLPLPPLGYIFEGDDDDYEFKDVDGERLLASQLLESENQLRVLDIGAAQGAFVLRAQRLGHVAHALTLHDYRGLRVGMTADRINPGSYLIGNAERLDEVEGLLDQYDLVVSRMTFSWLIDPLGALEQAANKVAPGGRLVINHVPIVKGLRPDNRRLNSTIDNIRIRDELVRAGFDQSSIVSGEGLRAIYAMRRQGIGNAAVQTAFAFGYDLPANGAGWRYVPVTPVIDPWGVV